MSRLVLPGMGAGEIDLNPPKGAIAWKYIEFRDNEDFAEMGMVGPYATAKSTALLDFLIRRAIDYPGSNTLIARAHLTLLKTSTLDKMAKRLGAVFESENKNEAIFRLPETEEPHTGKKVQSIIKGIGLERADLEQVFKSTEFFTGAIEEGDEVSSDSHDDLQSRLRQQCFHRWKKVRHLCMDLATKWNLTPDEVYEILLADPRNPVGQYQLDLDHPMPGNTVLKTVWNPNGNDHLWMRYVGVPYPEPRPTPEWVDENVGIREVHTDAQELRDDEFKFRAGSIVKLPPRMTTPENHGRGFAARHDDEKGVVHLVTGEEVPLSEAGLIVQRACIYAFRHENESRDYKNDENSYLMVNRAKRRRAFNAEIDHRAGRVFPWFIDDYIENGGHLMRYPEGGRDALAAARYYGVGGIDQGGDHATAMTAAFVTPETGILVFYDEYVRNGVAAAQSAIDALDLILPGMPGFWWGYDPQMNARRFDKDVEYATIDEYRAHLTNLIPGDRGKPAFDYVNGLLSRRDAFIGRQPAPKLLVFDNCHQIRETMLKLTWDHVSRQRGNWMVDVGDSIKIAASAYRKMSNHLRPNAVPTNLFEGSVAFATDF